MGTRGPETTTDWPAMMDRLVRGDPVAFAHLSRFVTGMLVHWRAYDFRDEWDDVIQEVLMAAIEAWRSGTLRKREAIVAYLRAAARFKFVDRIRRRRPESLDAREEEQGAGGDCWPPAEQDEPDLRIEVRSLLERLPEKQREAIVQVYGLGRTYEEAAEVTGIPLGSLKRHLRDGLAALRKKSGAPEIADPIRPGATTIPEETAAPAVRREYLGP
jgi:RNA polymerase sigma-70 factor (ECF subfamily)